MENQAFYMSCNEDAGINFSHLTEELSFFPFSCVNGYFFLWDCELPAPENEEKKGEKPEALVRNEIRKLKRYRR